MEDMAFSLGSYTVRTGQFGATCELVLEFITGASLLLFTVKNERLFVVLEKPVSRLPLQNCTPAPALDGVGAASDLFSNALLEL